MRLLRFCVAVAFLTCVAIASFSYIDEEYVPMGITGLGALALGGCWLLLGHDTEG